MTPHCVLATSHTVLDDPEQPEYSCLEECVSAEPLTITGDEQCTETEAYDTPSQIVDAKEFELSQSGCTITAKDYFEDVDSFNPPECEDLAGLASAVASPDWADGAIVGTTFTTEIIEDPGSAILYAVRFTISNGSSEVFAWLIWTLEI